MAGRCSIGSAARRRRAAAPIALAGVLVGTLFGLAACGRTAPDGPSADAPAREPATYEAELRWTSFGIPHVRAANWPSLGYGFAYATARDVVCTIAREVVRTSGELARHFGPDDGNLDSDVFHRAVLDEAAVGYFLGRQTDYQTGYMAGYVAGYNRYLRDHRDSLPMACRHAAWLREISLDDVARLNLSVGIRHGLERYLREVANAAPPGQPVTPLVSDFFPRQSSGGSAVALGKRVTESGRGLLLGSLDQPWQGAARLHLVHLTIPGQLNVMGASLATASRIFAGFNEDVAWTHTVSTGLRSTLYALTLEPGRPTRYRDGDGYRDMTRVVLAIPVKAADGTLATERRTAWFTRHGPVIVSDQLPWTAERAYAIRDANLRNDRTGASYDALSRARSIDEVENALYLQGIAWTQTIAADRHGTAYYADISVTPYIDDALLARCRVNAAQVPDGTVVLDGSDPACAWLDDPHSAVPGALPPEQMPRLRRDDFVVNADDSHWLGNPQAPLEGYSTLLGAERTARSLRTRAGLTFVADLLADGNRVGQDDLQDLLVSRRNFAAELLLDDLLRLCAGWGHAVELADGAVDIGPGCAALRDWNRTETVASEGAQVWREFWREMGHSAADSAAFWAEPFDVANPVGTPRGLAIDRAEVRDTLRAALATGLQRLAANGIAPQAALGDIQFEERNGERIPIPGGDRAAGLWSVAHGKLGPGGYTPIGHGDSWMQVVGWNSDGSIDARALLASAQSEDPASPHHADQTRLHAQGRWIRLPFSEEEIRADANLSSLNLRE